MTKMDLFDEYQKLITTVNSAQGGFVRPQANYQNWMNAINTELFRDMFSTYEKVQQASDELKLPFLKSINAVVTSIPGSPFDIIPYPANYEYFSDCRILTRKDGIACPQSNCDFMSGTDKNGHGVHYRWDDPDYAEIRARAEQQQLTELRVELIDNQYWSAVLRHVTKGPTRRRPYITQFDGGFKIAPAGIGVVVLDYLRTPGKALFAYTPGPGDTVIYDKPNSVQLEWSSIVENEFLSRLAMKYGLYTRDESVSRNAQVEYQIGHK